jgi:hypothetical protein
MRMQGCTAPSLAATCSLQLRLDQYMTQAWTRSVQAASSSCLPIEGQPTHLIQHFVNQQHVHHQHLTVAAQAIVDNECPECKWGDLDFGGGGDGRWPLKWSTIACPDAPIKVSQQGSNACYAKLKFEGGPGAIDSVSCGGKAGTATADGYHTFSDGSCPFCSGMSCQVKYKSGGSKSASTPSMC